MRVHAIAAALVLLAVASPASAGRFDNPALVIPFDYDGGLGVGAGQVQEGLVLTKDQEAVVISRALVAALQDRQFALVDPKLGPGATIPQNKTWSSDTVRISPELIAAHNKANPEMTLPPRFYSVQYSGAYRLDHRDLQFAISAQLFEQGAATSPRKFKGPYSGDFFVALLIDALKAKLVPPKVTP